jgi:hypothetical protein
MTTNLNTDGLGWFKSKKQALSETLRAFVQHRRQLKILELIGKVEYFPAYDYKRNREKR